VETAFLDLGVDNGEQVALGFPDAALDRPVVLVHDCSIPSTSACRAGAANPASQARTVVSSCFLRPAKAARSAARMRFVAARRASRPCFVGRNRTTL
jgi:hypothetical protein